MEKAGTGLKQDNIEQIAIPETIPILPVKDTVLFPFISLPLIISSKKSIKLLDDIMVDSKIFGLVTIRQTKNEEELTPDDLYQFGTVARVIRLLRFPEGSVRIMVSGVKRIKLEKFIQEDPYFISKITPVNDISEKSIEFDAMRKNVSTQFQKIISLQPYLPDELQIVAMNIENPGLLADFVTSNLNINIADKEDILETIDVKKRMEKVTGFLNKELRILELGSQIQ